MTWRWGPLESGTGGKAGRLIWLGHTDSAQSDQRSSTPDLPGGFRLPDACASVWSC